MTPFSRHPKWHMHKYAPWFDEYDTRRDAAPSSFQMRYCETCKRLQRRWAGQ